MSQLLCRSFRQQQLKIVGLFELNSLDLNFINNFTFFYYPTSTNPIISTKNHQIYRCFGSSFFRNPKRIESYFSAIGGESDDPPPDLNPEQVTAILRTNESLILNNKLAEENAKFLENFLDVLESKKLAKNKKFAALRKRKLAEKPEKKSSKKGKEGPLYSIIDHSWVTQVESNQLAANHPIEDRLRVFTFNFDLNDSNDTGIMCGVFDGHGGGFCADIIARRLFHYIAVGLKALQIRKENQNQNNNNNNNDTNALTNIPEWLANKTKDHTKSPSNFYHNIYMMYEEEVAQRLKSRIEEFEFESLKKFAEEELIREDDGLEENDNQKQQNFIKLLLERSFIRCDEDLSQEIESNINDTTSNLLLHYYHSLAVSGCCSTMVLIYENIIYVASTGDCRAVMGLLKKNIKSSSSSASSSRDSINKQLRMIELSNEHNADNANELNRIYSEHPKEEHNFIIRENRLLGQLMPLRAFGDFPFKWTVDKMKHLGLTRAFGSHVIPTFYRTPPYLTALPEITTLDLEQQQDNYPNIWLDRFIVLATDGLWEQFESPRKAVKAVNRYRQNWFQQIMAYTSAQMFNIEPKDGENNNNQQQQKSLTLQEIKDRLSKKIKEPPITTFKRITADDDLIEDINCGTYLLRTALSDISVQVPTPNIGKVSTELGSTPSSSPNDLEEEKFSHHVDQYEQQRKRHSKLVSYLTLPPTVVRNFRDDISLIVIGLK